MLNVDEWKYCIRFPGAKVWSIKSIIRYFNAFFPTLINTTSLCIVIYYSMSIIRSLCKNTRMKEHSAFIECVRGKSLGGQPCHIYHDRVQFYALKMNRSSQDHFC